MENMYVYNMCALTLYILNSFDYLIAIISKRDRERGVDKNARKNQAAYHAIA